MGDDNPCSTQGIGSVMIKHHDGVIRELQGVRYVPNLKKNLISLGTLESQGCKFYSENNILKVTRGALVMMKAPRKGLLYLLEGKTMETQLAMVAETDRIDSSSLWHMRLGHVGNKALQNLIKQGVLKGAKSGRIDFCEHCVLGKQTKVKFGTAIHQTKGILDYVHSDVWGPTKNESLGGKRWFVSFIDDFSRRSWIYTMKHKHEVLDIFLEWKNMVERKTGKKVKVLRSDNGGEYTSDPFFEICKKEGITRHFSVRHTPQQNGIAERLNRTLLEKVRCMLSQSKLSKRFWAEALSYACHIVNRLPSAALNDKTPIELWSGTIAHDYDRLRVFGCDAYYHVKEDKLDARARRATFLGFNHGVKGYRLWSSELKKIVVSRDVTFNETNLNLNEGVKEVHEVELSSKTSTEEDAQIEETQCDNQEDTQEEEIVMNDSTNQEESIAKRKGKREVMLPARFKDCVACMAYALPVIECDIPTNYTEAARSSESKQWHEAMDDEMMSLKKNNTWELVELPKGRKAIGCKWIFVKKDGMNDASPVRFKARLVAKGYAQKEGIDYNEIFSPVVKHSSIRILLALVAQFDLELVQMDVKTAFLHGNLYEEIYISQPEGYEEKGKEDLVCKLTKSLYGLKQSPRQWYLRFDKFMNDKGYTRSQYDHCVYHKNLSEGVYIYLLIYVDDMLIASSNIVEINKLKVQMQKEFEMKDLGDARKILGMEITRDRKKGMVWLSQKQYLEKLLHKFGINEQTKPVSTPLASHFKLSSQLCPKNDEEKVKMKDIPYSSVVGGLMYAMVCTRPDIGHAIGIISRFMHNPGREHWEAAKWVLRYLHGTRTTGICFERNNGGIDNFSIGYVDSDFASDLDKRRSTTGYIFTMAKGPICWRSILQPTVALSTTEAEYMAMAEAIKEAIWTLGLIEDLGVNQHKLEVYCDSQSAIYLAKYQVHHARTKHIDVRYHFVREVIAEGDILIKKVATADNPADMLTKVVGASKFQHCLDLVHVKQG